MEPLKAIDTMVLSARLEKPSSFPTPCGASVGELVGELGVGELGRVSTIQFVHSKSFRFAAETGKNFGLTPRRSSYERPPASSLRYFQVFSISLALL